MEYSYPFVDELVYPIIPEEATQIAALRTGTLDIMTYVSPLHWDSLEETAPGILYIRGVGSAELLVLQGKEPPFDDVNVRRAVMIGTDLVAFGELQGIGPLPIDWFPANRGNASLYVPIEDLPADAQLLYDYNPELAREMLDEAGVPVGTKVDVNVVSQAFQLDIASLLANQWAKIGLDVEIISMEHVAHEAIMLTRDYHGANLNMGFHVNDPADYLYRYGVTDGYLNGAGYSNEYYDELVTRMTGFMEEDERALMIKELGLILLTDVPYIPLYPEMMADYWWPWLKNYYGELSVGDYDMVSILAQTWIDQDLKEEMGY